MNRNDRNDPRKQTARSGNASVGNGNRGKRPPFRTSDTNEVKADEHRRTVKFEPREPLKRAEAGTPPSSANRQKKSGGLAEMLKSFFTPKVAMYFAIGFVLLLLLVCMTVSMLIGVSSIEVTGTDMSTKEEIIAASGIEEGSGYFSYNTKDAERNVLEKVPVVTEVEISRSLLGKVSIAVREEKAYWYVDVFGEYFALSESLEAVKKSDRRGEFIDRGLVRLDLPKIESVVLGRPIEFSDDGRDCAFVGELLSEIRESELYLNGRLDQVCIETKFEIFVVSDLQYKIKIGKYSGAKVKLDTVAKALEKDLFEEGETWELDASDVSGITSRRDHGLNFDYLRPEG